MADLLYWIEKHPSLASYIQAVGSIVAIIAAVWIARGSERARLASEASKAKIIHKATVMLAWHAIDAAKAAYQDLRRIESNNGEAREELLHLASMHLQAIKSIDAFQFPVPDMMVPFYKVRSELEEAMVYIHQLDQDKTDNRLQAFLSLEGCIESASMATRELAQATR
ncbi:hypothetical protein JSY17_08590 [Pseudomonas capsici]|uniref:hypothetical protein n=1 Tax=Pseudomonas capsici TaxID=2810614 RepID=UPI0019D1AB56|nr:hypothetical protein [Pseudomonas capsici]MBN6714051.1 hypothetical protein [Pseudomonas capsici]MBN6719393.1 hypothetical protein [Pseudomonas capsici]MBN6722793.1 hypothetical protein [Pseudomonas capsici]